MRNIHILLAISVNVMPTDDKNNEVLSSCYNKFLLLILKEMYHH